MGFGDECHIFLRGEENFSATPCRNFFHAMRQEGCKRNLDASSIGIDHVNLPLCSYFAFLCFCVFVKTSVRAYNIYNNQ